MFLPSFFTGSLIARFGILQIMGLGVALLTGHFPLTPQWYGLLLICGPVGFYLAAALAGCWAALR